MEESAKTSNESGAIKIASEVVTVIASMAATEVKGVSGMSGGFTTDFVEKFGVKSASKGIKVQVGETETSIDLYLIVEYGVRIPDVAWEVQQSVKKAVETMTGLNVVEVNIHIQGLNLKKEIKDADEIVSKDK